MVLDPLTAARAQMEVSLAFHMVFAALGICVPVLLFLAEGLWLRTGQPHYRDLARQWGKATALLFAVGAVSGTALSFELGLLWPEFMAFSGAAIGPAFTLEGFAFFVEAIFIGVWLYGWDKLSPRAHWLATVPIALSGALSGLFVVATNAWMQAPAGFTLDAAGAIVAVDGFAAFQSPKWLPMAFHLLAASFAAAAWAVAGVYAWAMRKDPRARRDPYHRSALKLAMAVAVTSTVLLGPSGDLSASSVYEHQPAKFAAMEAVFETQAGAPFTLGGIPDPEAGEVHWALEIPYLLSILATRDPGGVVQGLDQVPRDLWPNVVAVHLAFQLMLLGGFVLGGMTLWAAWAWWRRRDAALDDRRLLLGIALASPFGYLALQAGWVVTEMGRQPWVVYGLLRTEDAVTSAEGVPLALAFFTLMYLALAAALWGMLRYLAEHRKREGGEGPDAQDGQDGEGDRDADATTGGGP